jgi:hypothetical protein
LANFCPRADPSAAPETESSTARKSFDSRGRSCVVSFTLDSCVLLAFLQRQCGSPLHARRWYHFRVGIQNARQRSLEEKRTECRATCKPNQVCQKGGVVISQSSRDSPSSSPPSCLCGACQRACALPPARSQKDEALDWNAATFVRPTGPVGSCAWASNQTLGLVTPPILASSMGNFTWACLGHAFSARPWRRRRRPQGALEPGRHPRDFPWQIFEDLRGLARADFLLCLFLFER